MDQIRAYIVLNQYVNEESERKLAMNCLQDMNDFDHDETRFDRIKRRYTIPPPSSIAATITKPLTPSRYLIMIFLQPKNQETSAYLQ